MFMNIIECDNEEEALKIVIDREEKYGHVFKFKEYRNGFMAGWESQKGLSIKYPILDRKFTEKSSTNITALENFPELSVNDNISYNNFFDCDEDFYFVRYNDDYTYDKFIISKDIKNKILISNLINNIKQMPNSCSGVNYHKESLKRKIASKNSDKPCQDEIISFAFNNYEDFTQKVIELEKSGVNIESYSYSDTFEETIYGYGANNKRYIISGPLFGTHLKQTITEISIKELQTIFYNKKYSCLTKLHSNRTVIDFINADGNLFTYKIKYDDKSLNYFERRKLFEDIEKNYNCINDKSMLEMREKFHCLQMDVDCIEQVPDEYKDDEFISFPVPSPEEELQIQNYLGRYDSTYDPKWINSPSSDKSELEKPKTQLSDFLFPFAVGMLGSGLQKLTNAKQQSVQYEEAVEIVPELVAEKIEIKRAR